MKNSFTDHSLFEGTIQYFDEIGNEWRRERNGNTFLFFMLEEEAFVLQGVMRKFGHTKSIKHEHEAFFRIMAQ